MEKFTIIKKIYPLNNGKPYRRGTCGSFETKEDARAEIEKLKKDLPRWDCSTDFFIE
jgi:hypothetical protein